MRTDAFHLQNMIAEANDTCFAPSSLVEGIFCWLWYSRRSFSLQVPEFAARFAHVPNAIDTLVNRVGFHLDNIPERATAGEDNPVLEISGKSGHMRHLADQV